MVLIQLLKLRVMIPYLGYEINFEYNYTFEPKINELQKFNEDVDFISGKTFKFQITIIQPGKNFISNVKTRIFTVRRVTHFYF